MPKRLIGLDVFEAAVDRVFALYEQGHRPVVSFSGGKDSTVTLEVTKWAARRAGAGPVDVVMRDEEVQLPGTFEYCERVAEDPEVSFNWLIANQPVVNVFNREQPYFWTFDPLLPPEAWVRQPPSWATYIEEKHIGGMTTPDRFPPPPGGRTVSVIGLRTSESRVRLFTIHSAGGHMTKPNPIGVLHSRPIYDWTDGDVWRTIRDLKLDYSPVYNTLLRMGEKPHRLRVAPPTLNTYGVDQLKVASRAWPQWFEKVCERLPGVRAAAHYGLKAVTPTRAAGETWEQTFHRECIDTAPEWIAERSLTVRDRLTKLHRHHSTSPLPDHHACHYCVGGVGCWRKLAMFMWGGDPFAMKFPTMLKWVEPEFFRPGAGQWGGDPSW